tara:strand:+ start:1567 stop:2013 length:447 start_codon:yes stop_codon:yes gene_type:complete
MKLIIKNLCSDPWIYDIPLSSNSYINGSFSGYFTYTNKLATIARVYTTKLLNEVELADIYIAKELRGKTGPNNKKWSHHIMTSILNAIQIRNFKKIWLWTTIDNIKAIKLYEKFSFKKQNFPNDKKKQIYEKYKWLEGQKIIYMTRNI